MNIDDSYRSVIQWDRLIKRLVASAQKWFVEEECFEQDDVLPGTGKSAKELVFDAVTGFIKKEINWYPASSESANEEVYQLLRKVIRHDFLDLVKEGRAYKKTQVVDAIKDEEADGSESARQLALEELPDAFNEGFYDLDVAMTLRRIIPLLKGDYQLEEYVKAVLRHGCIKREDIATCLGISPDEVTKRQRRLQLRLASWRRSLNVSADKAIGHGQKTRSS